MEFSICCSFLDFKIFVKWIRCFDEPIGALYLLVFCVLQNGHLESVLTSDCF